MIAPRTEDPRIGALRARAHRLFTAPHAYGAQVAPNDHGTLALDLHDLHEAAAFDAALRVLERPPLAPAKVEERVRALLELERWAVLKLAKGGAAADLEAAQLVLQVIDRAS